MRTSPIYQEAPHSLRLIEEDIHISLTRSEVVQTQLHHHELVELSFVTEGEGVETINGCSHHLRQGTATFLLPHHVHQIRTESKTPIRKYCCMFNLDMFIHSSDHTELFTMLLQVGTKIPSWADISPSHLNRMQGLFEHIKEELDGTKAIGQSLLIRAKLTEALLLFIRSAYQDDRRVRNQSAYHSDTMVQTTFWSILSYIRIHFQEPLTLFRIAEQFHVSAPYISRSFKKHLGINFMDYVHLLRTNNAASLLTSTTMSITDIAISVGFNSFRTFSRVFRDVYSQTPSEYRKQNH